MMEDRPVNVHIQSSNLGREGVSPPPTIAQRGSSSSDGHVHPLHAADAYNAKSPSVDEGKGMGDGLATFFARYETPQPLFASHLPRGAAEEELEVDSLAASPSRGGSFHFVSTVHAREAYNAKPVDVDNGVPGMLTHGLSAFFTSYSHLKRSVNLKLATPTIRFQDLELKSKPRSRPWNKDRRTRVILHKMSGTIRPGTMTLVLGEPQSGKTSFLKALAAT
eukprot:g79296.t1